MKALARIAIGLSAAGLLTISHNNTTRGVIDKLRARAPSSLEMRMRASHVVRSVRSEIAELDLTRTPPPHRLISDPMPGPGVESLSGEGVAQSDDEHLRHSLMDWYVTYTSYRWNLPALGLQSPLKP